MSDLEWNFYDSDSPAIESRRNLPHIDMPGVLTFVTFRLIDSMPKHVVARWHNEIEQWLRENELAGKTVDEIFESDDIPQNTKNDLRRFKNRRWHRHLDDCHGACILRDSNLRDCVHDSLLHFDEKRCDVERFVIMPNHVHVLVQIKPEHQLRKHFREIQRYTARKINRLLSQSGSIWQGEPFDHLVRNERQFEYLQNYINDNPTKAGLSQSEYTLWIRPASP